MAVRNKPLEQNKMNPLNKLGITENTPGWEDPVKREMLDKLIQAVQDPVKFSWTTSDVIILIENALNMKLSKIKEIIC